MKRRKVLLPEFLDECLIKTSEAADSSVGDSIRMHLCHSLISAFMILHPEYEPSIDALSQYKSILEECRDDKFDLIKRKKHVLDCVFECQRIFKYHLEQQEKKCEN